MRQRVLWTAVLLFAGASAAPGFGQEHRARDGERRIAVRVVSGESGAALPGRSLRVSTFPQGEGRTLPEGAAARRPVVHVGDDATLSIAVPDEPVSLALSDGELAGWLDVGPDTLDATLHLLPPHAVAVRVVDADGARIAGLPVRLNVQHRPVVRSNDHGIAVFPDGRLLVPPYEHPDPAASVVLDVTQHAPLRAPLQVRRLPHGPVDLVVPTAPPLTVRVRGPSGHNELHPATAYLKGADAWASLDGLATAGYAAPVVDGHALFPWVPDGLDVEIVAVSADAKRPTGRVTVRTPAKDVELTIGVSRTWFAGTLVDASRRPLAGRYVTAQLRTPAGDWLRAHAPVGIPTGEDGRFRIELDATPERCAGGRLHLIVHTVDVEAGNTQEKLRPIDIERHREAADTDLGTLVVGPDPRAATGRVLDPNGDPVAGWQLYASRRDGERWVPIAGWTTVSDHRGAFVLPDAAASGAVALWGPDGSHYLPDPVVVQPGDGGVTLHVRPCGSVSGSVRSDVTGMHAVARISGEPAAECRPPGSVGAEHKVGIVGRRGRFTLTRLRPGRGRVEIVVGGSVVAAIDGVDVPEGEAGRDSRLQGIEIAAAASRAAVVTVVDADGTPLPRVRIRFAAEEARGWAERETDADGHATVPVGTSPPRVAVVRRGFATVLIERFDTDRTVALQPIPVRRLAFRVRGLAEALADGFEASARLVWCDPPGVGPAGRPSIGDPRNFGLEGHTPVPAGGELVLETWEPGVYALLIFLGRPGPGRSVGLRAIDEPRALLTPDGAPAETIVEIDPDDLQRKLALIDAD